MNAYTDSRCYQIEENFNYAVAEYADRNLAGWVLDGLADKARCYGVMAGTFCDGFRHLWNPCQDAMDHEAGLL